LVLSALLSEQADGPFPGQDLALKGEVNGAALGRFRLYRVAGLQAAQIVPEAYALPQQNRRNGNMQAVDKAGLEVVAHHAWSAANSDIPAVCEACGLLERIGLGGIDKVERGATRHFDEGTRLVGQDKDRAVERRFVAPPPLPVRVIREVMQAELARPHDLRADIGEVILRIFIVYAGGAFAAGVLEHALLECPSRHIGADKARPVFAKWLFGGLAGGCREAIKRNDKINTNGHERAPFEGGKSAPKSGGILTKLSAFVFYTE
jgi:hypothetical protein